MAWSAAADPAPLSATYAAGPEPEPRCSPSPEGDARVDVAIVGAGFTGLSAALTLAQAGARVRVLEARQVGWGGSGRAFGQVVPYSKLSEPALLRLLGPDWGERLLHGLADGPATVAQLVQRHGIRCELDRSGLLFAAHAERARPALERRARFWRDRGAAVEMVDGPALEALTGTRAYDAALLDRRGLTLNPLAYARGLARAVLDAGGSVHTGTVVTALQQDARRWQVVTPRGSVTAEHVMLAAAGLNGRGIAFGTLLGREAAARVLQKPEDEWMMPNVKLQALPPRPILRPALAALVAAYRALDAFEMRSGR